MGSRNWSSWDVTCFCPGWALTGSCNRKWSQDLTPQALWCGIRYPDWLLYHHTTCPPPRELCMGRIFIYKKRKCVNSGLPHFPLSLSDPDNCVSIIKKFFIFNEKKLMCFSLCNSVECLFYFQLLRITYIWYFCISMFHKAKSYNPNNEWINTVTFLS